MPKPCDACQSSSAVLYCRADTAYLCAGCDKKVHGANKLAQRHERVWVCDVCEVSPAVVTCKADAAALCISCDTDIHSANPLARRHERTPVTPFYEFPGQSMKVAHINTFVVPQSQSQPQQHQSQPHSGAALTAPTPASHHQHHHYHHHPGERRGSEDVRLDADEHSVAEEAASWLLPNPKPTTEQMLCGEDGKSTLGQGGELTGSLETNHEDGNGLESAAFLRSMGGFSPTSPFHDGGLSMHKMSNKSFKVEMHNGDLFSDLDPYLDLDYATAIGTESTPHGNDSLVPVRHSDSLATQSTSPSISTGSGSFDEAVCKDGYAYGNQSLSSSSLDVGIVPDSSVSDSSNSYMDGLSQGFEFPPKMLHMGQVEAPMAREARVLRYREKRKNRKFEKTIRYASRKAYAESRPRIKGRFAKRTPAEMSEMQEAYPLVRDTGFGVVPAF